MGSEYELTSRVVSFLEDNGYPRDCILQDYTLPNSDGRSVCRVDIAIAEPGQLQPIAIFEVKAYPFSQQMFDSAIHQINWCVSRLRSSVRPYLVLVANNKMGFTIRDVTTDKNLEEEVLPHIVSFENLVRGNIAERRSSEIQEKGDRHDALVRWRWVGILVLGGLFTRDYYRNGWGLSWERLSILCGAFVLWLLPYFDVIGFKDIILQRHQEKADSWLSMRLCNVGM